jgi:hypothetical protein
MDARVVDSKVAATSFGDPPLWCHRYQEPTRFQHKSLYCGACADIHNILRWGLPELLAVLLAVLQSLVTKISRPEMNLYKTRSPVDILVRGPSVG